MKTLLIFGFGYVAEHFAQKVSGQFQIYGTTRSSRTASNVELLNYNDLSLLPKDVTHILFSIPPNEEGDPALLKYIEQIKRLPNLKHIVYLSSTGVYADAGGAWVDEKNTHFANNHIAKARLKAEEQFKSLSTQCNVAILRLAGIYGPGRNQVDQLRNGTLRLIDKPDQIFSRVHVEDIASAIERSFSHEKAFDIFNIADDYPCSPKEVAEYASKLTDIPLPEMQPYDPETLSEMARIFYSQSKRVRSTKAKELLGWQLKYPTFQEGLISCANYIKNV